MKIHGQKIEIGSGFREEDGTPLDPELQPVRRTLTSDADANAGEQNVGKLPVTITAEMPAIEAAEVLGRVCSRCAHWDRKGWNWRDHKARLLAGGPDGHATLSQIRAEVLSRGVSQIPGLDNGNGDFDDVDHAVAACGVCRALSMLAGDDVIAFPQATCPTEHAGLFVPRAGGDARRQVTAIYDAILQAANKR